MFRAYHPWDTPSTQMPGSFSWFVQTRVRELPPHSSHSSMSEFYSNNSYLPPKKWLVKLASRNPHKCFLARHPPYFSMQQKYFMNTYHLGTLYKKDILKGQDLLKLTIFTAFSRTFLRKSGSFFNCMRIMVKNTIL